MENITNENKKTILDEESTEYINTIESLIKLKFKEYINKLQSKEELLLNSFKEKLIEVQVLKNNLSTSIQERENNKTHSSQNLQIAEETKLLKDTLNNLCNKVEKLEQAREILNNSKLSEVINIKDDDFIINYKICECDNNTSLSAVLKSGSPAGKPVRNICIQCRNQLEWNQSYFSIKCNCTNTNSHYIYGCTNCKITYCTACSFPIDVTICGCGNKLQPTDVYSNICDLCRLSISHSYRCSDCDYDVCEACYRKHK